MNQDSDNFQDQVAADKWIEASVRDLTYRQLFDRIFGYPPGHAMTAETVEQWVHEWIDNRIQADLKGSKG